MSYRQLSENERYKIYALKKAGHSQKEIVTKLYTDISLAICCLLFFGDFI